MKSIKSLVLLSTILVQLAVIFPTSVFAQGQESGANTIYLPIISNIEANSSASMPSEEVLAARMAHKYDFIPITGEWVEAHGNWLASELERLQNIRQSRRSNDIMSLDEIESMIDYSNEPKSPELDALSEEMEIQAAGNADKGDGKNNVDLSGTKAGDILLGHADQFQFWGWWRHAAITHNSNTYVEAPGGANGNIRTNPIHKWKSSWDAGALLRVDTTDTKRSAAANYALNQKNEKYDIWSSKSSQDAWYCSKLAWAAYYYTSQEGWKWWTQIDLDTWGGYWVTPDDLWYSWSTEIKSASW